MSLVLRQGVAKTPAMQVGLYCVKVVLKSRADGAGVAIFSDEREVKILFEILEQRCEMNLSTMICSQREPASWSAMILNDEVSANAILKRATKHYTVVIKPVRTG